ncbi:MAG: HAD hydrolase-like protein [Candidatus Helarchaeota archaeon]
MKTLISKEDMLDYLKNKRDNTKIQYIVFDIDDTIMDTAERKKIIYNRLKKMYDLPTISSEEFEKAYNIAQILVKYNFQEDEILKINQKFVKLFLSNKYILKDRPFPGIKDIINELLKMNYYIIYLTGRTINLRKKTIKSFKMNEIPIQKPNIDLVMKKDNDCPDLTFKLEYIKNFREKENIVCFIDNDSETCNELKRILNSNLIIKFYSTQKDNLIYNGPYISKWA